MTNSAEPTERFLRVCRGLPVDRTPVWFMRQAGRYQAEYRALRQKYSMLEMIRTPELATQVTMLPINQMPVDAAILFSDIIPILEGMGLKIDFVDGEGPQIFNPIRSVKDIEALRVQPAQETLPYVLEAIRMIRRELAPKKIPLIGFSGAPFTLATYAIEGKGSKTYQTAKTLMWSEPKAWHELMGKLSQVVGEYMLAQANAGAQALQMFDSWVGALSPADYREFVLPYSRAAIAMAQKSGVPVIHFGVGTSNLLEDIRSAGSEIIGIDAATDIDSAWKRIGDDRALQGNLDPVALFAPWEVIKTQAERILKQVAGRPGHIFNLGHGILPGTPVDNVKRLVDFVHEHSAK